MSQLKNVWKEIAKHKRFLITSHHNPDADAASSSLAMALVLRKMGKKVFVANEDSLPSWLSFLPSGKIFHRNSLVKKPDFDCVIVLDCGDKERIGGVHKWIDSQRVINIDHHITNDHFGDVNLVVPKASSTCEVLYDLLQEAKVRLNKDIAKLLYAGIMTDTGSFRFENTSAKTFEIASKLVALKVPVNEYYNRLYKGIPSSDIKGFVEVIHQAQLLYNNKVYCVMLPKKLTDSFSKDFDLKEKIFTFLRTIEGIEVVVIFSELASKETRINFRSQHKIDVAKLASQFNGGGHIRAAGAKLQLSLVESQKKVLAAIKKLI